MWSFSLLANLLADSRNDPLSRPEILWGTLGLTVALLAGAAVIYAVDKWRKRAATGSQDEGAASLTSFRAMYEAGEITEAEYAELKRRLAEKVKSNGAQKPGGTGDTAPPSPQPGERPTLNPPAPPSAGPFVQPPGAGSGPGEPPAPSAGPSEPPPPPSTA